MEQLQGGFVTAAGRIASSAPRGAIILKFFWDSVVENLPTRIEVGYKLFRVGESGFKWGTVVNQITIDIRQQPDQKESAVAGAIKASALHRPNEQNGESISRCSAVDSSTPWIRRDG